jgi:TonB family protein
MIVAVEAAIRVSAILLAALVLRALLARRAASVRHAIVATAIAAAAVVVPASFAVPAVLVIPTPIATASPQPEARVSEGLPVGQAGVSGNTAAARSRGMPSAILLAWLTGVAIAASALAGGVIRLVRIAGRARPLNEPRWRRPADAIAATFGLRRRVILLETDAAPLLATWGARPARILLPPRAREWSDERIRAVLCHELAHVSRGDWLTQIAAQVFLALFWFNPLAWIACRCLRRDSEQACDDHVLRRGVSGPEYATHLIALARECRRPRWSWVPALPIAHPSAFERRIAAMLNPRLDRRPLSRGAAGIIVLALLVLTVATASVRAVQEAPAALTGTVYDTTGSVMPGVTVTLEDVERHVVQASTDTTGRFAFPGVGSGHYTLSAALPGFRLLRDAIDLTKAADWDRVITLQLGTVQETINVRATRETAPPAAVGGPTRVRVGGNVRVPRKTHDVKPVYPASMRAAGREGQVQLEAVIGTDGSVSAVRVLGGQVHPDFAIAAADAVRQWQFTPTLLNGQPAEVVMTVTVTFSLSD